jgi:L-threonylcarbamoyladenylate synthase
MTWVSQFRLRLACEHVREGGVIAYPTEAVFGLGCDPFNPYAIMKLLTIKGRSAGKGFIVIASNFSQLAKFIAPLEESLEREVLKTWPGPVTWIWAAKKSVPIWLTGARGTIAVRVSAHPICVQLCEALANAIVSTSANPSRGNPAKSPLKVRKYFKGYPIKILPGSVGVLPSPTAIYDAASGTRLR